TLPPFLVPVVTCPSHGRSRRLTGRLHAALVRIGLVSDTYTPQVNGVTTVVRRIVGLLRAEGHEAAVVAPRYPAPAAPADGRELRVPSLAMPLYPAIRLPPPASRPRPRSSHRSAPHRLRARTPA